MTEIKISLEKTLILTSMTLILMGIISMVIYIYSIIFFIFGAILIMFGVCLMGILYYKLWVFYNNIKKESREKITVGE